MILDQESPVISYELFSSNILWPRSFTFIGYLPNPYRSTNSYIFQGFRGAIQKVNKNKCGNLGFKSECYVYFKK